MCGIAGVFGESDRESVDAMLATLRHRGPDDGWIVGGERFTLGARRLSIVDVSGGRQPMSNETATVWAAQNGELYNDPRLRPELVARGHSLHTRCDTELLPHAYEQYGLDLPCYIDGMFAVAVWDGARRVGLLARDRMGKKPLYYCERHGSLYFASEIKALLAIPGFSREIDPVSLHHFLSLKHVPHPRSIFEGIKIVPPAHRLVFRPGEPIDVDRYWDVSFDVDETLAALPEDDLVERFLHLLRKAVDRRLMSDVPIGFFLSGG